MEFCTNKKSAFTLIELLLVVLLVAILMPMAAFSFSNAKTKLEFESDVAQVMEMFRNMRNLAMTNRQDPDPTALKVDRYGIKFDATSGISVSSYYVDSAGTSVELKDLTTNPSQSTDEKMKAITTMTMLYGNMGDDLSSSGTGANMLTVEFSPPYGDIAISSGARKMNVQFQNRLGDTESITINDIAGIPEFE